MTQANVNIVTFDAFMLDKETENKWRFSKQ